METGGITQPAFILHCSDWNPAVGIVAGIAVRSARSRAARVLLDFVVNVMVAPLSASPEAGFWPIT